MGQDLCDIIHIDLVLFPSMLVSEESPQAGKCEKVAGERIEGLQEKGNNGRAASKEAQQRALKF